MLSEGENKEKEEKKGRKRREEREERMREREERREGRKTKGKAGKGGYEDSVGVCVGRFFFLTPEFVATGDFEKKIAPRSRLPAIFFHWKSFADSTPT